MKIAILSDIHGNNHTFFKAMALIESMNVEYIFFCGDFCGYYYGQNEIIEYMRNRENIICIIGNHDKLFLEYINDDVQNRVLSENKSFLLLSRRISKDNLKYLEALPSERTLIIDELKFGLFHGTPWSSIDEYCYPDYDFEKYKVLDYDYIFQGHTHYRMYKKVESLKIINPGSLGQPRDYKCPSFVVIDTKADRVEFHDVHFDIEQLIREIKDNEEDEQPRYSIDVLRRIGKNEKKS